MNVIYWSDYACPFCYIGAEILKQAFALLHTGGKIHIVMKSFELDPTTPRNVLSSTPECFASIYGMTLAQASARIEAISEIRREAGLNFRYATTKYTSTLDAHRINTATTQPKNFQHNSMTHTSRGILSCRIMTR